MILAVDIGNTNVVLGCIEGEEILFLERMATDRRATAMEYLVRIRSVLKYREIDPGKLEGAIICSVVPIVTMQVRPAVEQLTLKQAVAMQHIGQHIHLAFQVDEPEFIHRIQLLMEGRLHLRHRAADLLLDLHISFAFQLGACFQQLQRCRQIIAQ